MTSIRQFLAELPRPFIIGVAFALVVAIVVVERYAVVGDSLWVLLIVPVTLATWYADWRWGVSVAALPFLFPVLSILAVPENPQIETSGSEVLFRLSLLLAYVYVLTESRSSTDNKRESVRTDPSTGLANSRAFFDLVAGEVDRAQRYGRFFSIAYVGIENLPTVRQRAGNDAAEEVLRGIARQIRNSLRSVDHVARLRDREFALLLPETGPEAASAVLGRMNLILAGALATDPHAVSIVIGALTWVKSDLTVEALHQRAYQIMYSARQENVRVKHEILESSVHDQAPQGNATIPPSHS
jgi:diguanylate cyclase (GGDEF)-like protein